MILGVGTEREALPMSETISVTRTPDRLRAVRASVEAGEYASVDALLDEAVHARQRQRRADAERPDDIRTRIRRSLHDPRPDLSIEEVQKDRDRMFAEARHDTRRAETSRRVSPSRAGRSGRHLLRDLAPESGRRDGAALHAADQGSV